MVSIGSAMAILENRSQLYPIGRTTSKQQVKYESPWFREIVRGSLVKFYLFNLYFRANTPGSLDLSQAGEKPLKISLRIQFTSVSPQTNVKS